jgi:oxygen-independent coproporphyrinogen III oxidase
MFDKKDTEFIAWYPLDLTVEEAAGVWHPRRAGYYVHIPFCTAICDYCGFAVERAKSANVSGYLDALRLEIRRYADQGRLASHRLLFGHFGGGTPSILEAKDLLDVKSVIESSFEVAPDAEVTVEVNPISFTLDKATAYREAGVNRVSLGVQSFNEGTLRTIGRPHRAGDVHDAAAVIRSAGFENYSLDIIYGAPGQTPSDLRDDLLRAVDTGATHLSCFRLEIIPFTALKLREAAGRLPPRLSEAMLNEMDDLVTEVLEEAGFRGYGVFNFCRPGFESRYNEIAFVAPQGEYVGFGNSSYSFLSQHVYCNHADVATYTEAVLAGRDPIARAGRVSGLDAMARYFVLGVKFLRVPRAGFVQQFGMEPEQIFGQVLDRLLQEGMLVREDDDYVLTRRGRQYVANVSKEFYVGASRGRRQHAQFVPTLTAAQIERYAKLAGLAVSAPRDA